MNKGFFSCGGGFCGNSVELCPAVLQFDGKPSKTKGISRDVDITARHTARCRSRRGRLHSPFEPLVPGGLGTNTIHRALRKYQHGSNFAWVRHMVESSPPEDRQRSAVFASVHRRRLLPAPPGYFERLRDI